MFPAKIFRLLPHDVSPCPANAHSTRVVFFILLLCPQNPPQRGFDKAELPVHALFKLMIA